MGRRPAHRLTYVWHDLQRFAAEEPASASQEDRKTLEALLEELDAAPSNITAPKAAQMLLRSIKSNKAERSVLLDILGVCSVLETPQQKGFAERFVRCLQGAVSLSSARKPIGELGVQRFLCRLREQLRSGSYRPVPVRERMIPVRGGKTRRPGIPTVSDRVVQAALKLVLEPIFEAGFQPVRTNTTGDASSFGLPRAQVREVNDLLLPAPNAGRTLRSTT